MAIVEPAEHCIGCGAVVPKVDGPVHRYMTSAPGCWVLWGTVNARILSDEGAIEHRQFCVDAYAVQHPGGDKPQAIQSVVGHLTSLYVRLELKGSLSDASRAMEAVIRRKGRFHRLDPPSFAGARTVADVAQQLDRLPEAARAWAADAWHAWHAHHAQIREWHAVMRRDAS